MAVSTRILSPCAGPDHQLPQERLYHVDGPHQRLELDSATLRVPTPLYSEAEHIPQHFACTVQASFVVQLPQALTPLRGFEATGLLRPEAKAWLELLAGLHFTFNVQRGLECDVDRYNAYHFGMDRI